MAISRSQFNAITEIITDYVSSGGDPRAIVSAAFYGTSLFRQITYSGNPGEFATHVVTIADNYGEIEPGKLAVVALLEAVRDKVGGNKQTEINDLIAEITGGTVPQPAAPVAEMPKPAAVPEEPAPQSAVEINSRVTSAPHSSDKTKTQRRGQNLLLIGTITAAALALIGTVVTAYINISNGNNQIQLQLTADALRAHDTETVVARNTSTALAETSVFLTNEANFAAMTASAMVSETTTNTPTETPAITPIATLIAPTETPTVTLGATFTDTPSATYTNSPTETPTVDGTLDCSDALSSLEALQTTQVITLTPAPQQTLSARQTEIAIELTPAPQRTLNARQTEIAIELTPAPQRTLNARLTDEAPINNCQN